MYLYNISYKNKFLEKEERIPWIHISRGNISLITLKS